MIILNNLYIQLKYQILLAYDFTYFQISQFKIIRSERALDLGCPLERFLVIVATNPLEFG